MFYYSTRAFSRCFILLLVLFGLLPGTGMADDDLQPARDAYRLRQADRLEQIVQQMAGSPLQSYAAYYALLLNLSSASESDVQRFYQRYPDSPLIDRVRSEWLKVLGKRKNWPDYLTEYPQLASPDKQLQCFYLQARLDRGENVAADARLIWQNGDNLPNACEELFATLIQVGQLHSEDVWDRLHATLTAGNAGTAQNIAILLPHGPTQLTRVAENPQRYLDQLKRAPETRAARETVRFAVLQLARSNAPAAADQWQQLQTAFPAAERADVWGRIATEASRRQDPQTLDWFAMAGNAPLSDFQLGWKVRAALRQKNWTVVLDSINHMTPEGQQDSAWRYWKGRALKEQGQIQQANALFLPLSREYSFYGQLASEEMGTVLSAPNVSYHPGSDEIRLIAQVPGIQRALLLYQQDMRYEANREWIYASRNFNDKQLLAAAALARQSGWLDRAINTADKTRQLHDFAQRYPTPERSAIEQYAQQNLLDEAWVYGLIRQESRFVTQAKSSVGAMGWMQLMPGTAKWVAKKLGWAQFRPQDAHDLETNIALGTYYLRHVYDLLDQQPVLATAAYNAGPGRARRWQPSDRLEGAIYAESIPFSETRDYVKKVMSNAVYYSHRLGDKIVSLKQRLGIIGPPGQPVSPQEP